MQDQKTVLQTAREITMAEITATFLEEELLGCSPMTWEWYRCRLGLLTRALGPERELSSIEKKDLIRWWRSLEARTHAKPATLSPETFHGYVRAARRLFKWMYENNLIISDFWKALKLPKIPKRTRKGVKDELVQKLIEASRDHPRDHAIFHFMESTGARRGGIVALRMDDISPEAAEPFCRQATVHEKGLKDRQVFMSPTALEALRAWLLVRKSKTDFVFVDERPGHDRWLEPGAINQIIERYKVNLGIKNTKGDSPHQWRHRRSRILLKNGMPLNLVSQVLGHSNVTVTAEFYGNLLTDELQAAYDHYSKTPDQGPKQMAA